MAHIFLWISYLNFKGVRAFPGWTFIVTFIFPYLSLLSVNLALSLCACNIPNKSAKLSRNCYNFPQQLKVNPMLSHRFTLQFKNTTNGCLNHSIMLRCTFFSYRVNQKDTIPTQKSLIPPETDVFLFFVQIYFFCFYKYISFLSTNIFLFSLQIYFFYLSTNIFLEQIWSAFCLCRLVGGAGIGYLYWLIIF